MISFLARVVLKIWGLSYDPFPSHLKKYLLVVAPHTSNRDFILGLLLRSAWKARVSYIGKSSLFKFPQSLFFRFTGGIPVDRSKNNKLVDAISDMFNNRESLAIALAPEGTRKKVARFKTGFYYIAKKAQIPVVLVKLDLANKHIGVAAPFHITEDIDKVMEKVFNYFSGVKGFRAGNSVY